MQHRVRIAARVALAGRERRRAARNPVTIPSAIQVAAADVEAIIRDISAHGFMAEVGGDYRPDTYISVRLPGAGVRHARVAWATAGRIGAEFVHPLEPATLDALIRCRD